MHLVGFINNYLLGFLFLNITYHALLHLHPAVLILHMQNQTNCIKKNLNFLLSLAMFNDRLFFFSKKYSGNFIKLLKKKAASLQL